MNDEKEFFELGKKMFDRLNPPLVQREWIETNNSACKILRQVHDMLALASFPPRKTWVGLTDAEVDEIYEQTERLVGDSWVGNGTVGLMFPITLCKMFEDKLKEKNNG